MKLNRLCCFLVAAVALVSSEARAQVFDLLWSGGLGTGTGAQALLSGDMDGDGRTDILHPWSNNGTLGLHVYQSTGTSYVNAFTSGNMGEGAAALAWLAGDMDGDGRTDILQPWNNNGQLGLIVYRSTGTGYTNAFSSTNMGAGSPAVGWLTGDADGDGRTDLIQLWNNHDWLGLTVFRSTGTGYSLWFNNPNMGQGSAALAWLTGDMDGDGRTDIFQPWKNNGTLGLIAYRATGAGYATAFASSNMGQGWAALAWLVGDMDGDGRADILQPFNNQGALGLIAYRSNGTGFATAFASSNLGPASGTGTVVLRTGDLNGDGLTDLFQTWNSTGFDVNVYRSNGTGYSLVDSYFNCCFGGHMGWLVGSFDGGPRESLLHLFPFDGLATMIVYGLR
jgi:FG-GAP-like repeat